MTFFKSISTKVKTVPLNRHRFSNNIHALPGTTNHERTGQHIVLSYKRLNKLRFLFFNRKLFSDANGFGQLFGDISIVVKAGETFGILTLGKYRYRHSGV